MVIVTGKTTKHVFSLVESARRMVIVLYPTAIVF